MSAEEKWAQQKEWDEERRRGFDREDSHEAHIERKEFPKSCALCQQEKCPECDGQVFYSVHFAACASFVGDACTCKAREIECTVCNATGRIGQ